MRQRTHGQDRPAGFGVKEIMALLHLIDRPEETAHPRSRHGVSAAVSACSHVLIATALLIGLRQADRAGITKDAAHFDSRMIWIPSALDGGGRNSGGDRSTEPARRAQARGSDHTSVPAKPEASASSLADAPVEPINISARPMGDSHQMLPGAITSERPGDALGQNLGRGGDGDRPAGGPGTGPDDGIGDGVRSAGPGVTTPVPIHQVKPQYTSNAMRVKVQGIVALECVVLPDGTVGGVRIVRSLDRQFGLDEEAIAAAKRWRFKPGMMNGRAVAVAIRIELTFTLR
jgi:TonB family protein